MCKISIVMPVYNKEKYIARGINSILAQTFNDWELIIIDDGSTDGSLNQCKKFRDSRIQVFHTLNRGVSEARNLGISKATGEYITFIDSDDFVAENYLEKIYRPDEEMVIGGVAKVDINGKVIEYTSSCHNLWVLPRNKSKKQSNCSTAEPLFLSSAVTAKRLPVPSTRYK